MQRSHPSAATPLRSPLLTAAFATLLAFCHGAWSAQPATKIVLIGGPTGHALGIGEHDFPDGIRLLKDFLDRSPANGGAEVVAYPDGWPTDAAALVGTSTLVLYFDGVGSHPLNDAQHRAQFEKLMKGGAGAVALHQASTVPEHDTTIDLPRWLGGARYGMVDRTTETILVRPAPHPIGNGVGEFLLTDEFYPTIRFYEARKGVTPILTGKLHPQYRDGKFLVTGKAETHPVAWAFEREDGGRAFTFTGLHYLTGLDDPALRKLLLNAIFWTAKLEVPTDGVATAAPADAARTLVSRELALAGSPPKRIEEATIRRRADYQVVDYPWGHLTWYVSRELKNSDTMTSGEAVIKPGQGAPRHFHPNCDEVLHVLRGDIVQSVGDKQVEMHQGDTVSIPAGVHHGTRNVGTGDVVLSLSYSSADRQTVSE